jgi:hypothetical protein
VLETLVTTYPEDGVILGLRLRAGWGNTLQVEIAPCQRSPALGITVASPLPLGNVTWRDDATVPPPCR